MDTIEEWAKQKWPKKISTANHHDTGEEADRGSREDKESEQYTAEIYETNIGINVNQDMRNGTEIVVEIASHTILPVSIYLVILT